MSKQDFVTMIIPRMILRVPVERVLADDPDCLTSRELQVFQHLVKGKLSNKEIGSVLNCSESAVKKHVSSIYGKLAVRDRPEFLTKYGRAE